MVDWSQVLRRGRRYHGTTSETAVIAGVLANITLTTALGLGLSSCR
jgi:hypothetical protein